MGKLFGTDGVRGIANSELTCELAMNIGRAAAYVLTKREETKPKILIGGDTRVSTNMLEMALAAGLCSVGADVVLVGYIPTPAIAYLTKKKGFDAGIMISASHNPCEYNGIKIFDSNGYKLPDAVENEIEDIIFNKLSSIPAAVGGELGSVFRRPDYVDDYIAHLASTVDVRLDGLKIALDCANGSASVTAQKLFTSLGAECHMLSYQPNGVNINLDCGSTHLDQLTDFVNGNDMDVGFAFDGDADRCLAVDENGSLIDGDKLIAVFAANMKENGQLTNNTAVITVMTNIGFKKFAAEQGIDVAVTTVGDRYVLEEMLKKDYAIGGEQSGHIIFKRFVTTGDGQLSALQFAAIMARKKKSASAVSSVMKSYPQVMVNITASSEQKPLLKTDEGIIASISEVEKALGDNGRILVRASGTEPLIRVMIEGEDVHLINRLAESVAGVIKERIKDK